MATNIQTIATRVTKNGDDAATRTGQLGYRQQDLSAHARRGFALVSTVAIESTEYVTLVDTLQRLDED